MRIPTLLPLFTDSLRKNAYVCLFNNIIQELTKSGKYVWEKGENRVFIIIFKINFYQISAQTIQLLFKSIKNF